MIRKGYRYLLTAVIAASAAALLTFAARNDFGLGRNMEITVNMMRELSLGYVDPVDPDKLMEGAAEGMVSDLDPYTEFIPEDQMSNFELLTTGKYGGGGPPLPNGAPPQPLSRCRRPLPRAERRRAVSGSCQCGERCAQGGKAVRGKELTTNANRFISVAAGAGT